MKPLISVEPSDEEPETETYLLFPYERDDAGTMGLVAEAELSRKYPLARQYLGSWETKLRGREGDKMDREGWWAYNYPKNLISRTPQSSSWRKPSPT